MQYIISIYWETPCIIDVVPKNFWLWPYSRDLICIYDLQLDIMLFDDSYVKNIRC